MVSAPKICLSAQYRILEDRADVFYEHRLAA